MAGTESPATSEVVASEEVSPSGARIHGARRRLRDFGEAAALVVLVGAFAVLNPDTFLTLVNVRVVLDQASLPLVLGVGATLVVLMGSIDLSIEGVMGAAGMTFVLLTANSRDTVDLGPLAIVAGVLVGMTLGGVAGAIHIRLRVPSFIVTLGFWFVGLGLATVLFGEDQIPFLPDGGLKAWPTERTLGLPNSFVLAVVVVALGMVLLRYTRVGRMAYAIGGDEQIARDNGLPVDRHKLFVFVIAGACSALAGILATLQLGAGSATVGVGTLFVTIAAVVIGGTALGGGRGGIGRTVLGVMLLTVLNNGLILSGVSPNVQSAVAGVVLIVAVAAASWPHRSRLRIVK